MIAGETSDKLNDYGLTSVLLYNGDVCLQMVMSCRVFGLGVEFKMLKEFLKFTSNSSNDAYIMFKNTGKNALCFKFLTKLQINMSENSYDIDTKLIFNKIKVDGNIQSLI